MPFKTRLDIILSMQPLSNIDKSWTDASPIDEDGRLASTRDNVGMKVTKNPLLKNIPPRMVKHAWFIMAHLVLEKGSKVLNMRAGDGAITYTMAALNPDIEFIGIDRNPVKTDSAKEKYSLPNLRYMNNTIQENFTPPESIDAIINSFNLHEIYSENNCNERAVTDTLERQLTLLKKGGYIYTQGYCKHPEDKYVLMEMPDEPSKSKDIKNLSEIELLISYSEAARSRENDNYRGFYLEEMPARFPRTRLFRLPAKWAYEFIIRKDNRDKWATEISKEYSFFSRDDYSRIVREFGARLLYSAPHWDEEVLKNHYHNKLRLFEESGDPLGSPETSFVLVAQKTAEKQSLTLQERKPSKSENPSLRITAMRNEYDGTILDIVSRDMHITEILPYRVTSENKLNIFIHEGIPRCLANTVPRKAPNIDGKLWSGHMIEAFAIPQEIIENIDKQHFRSTMTFTQDYLGLKPEMGKLFENGPGFYPAPDCIDEHVDTLYISVKHPESSISPNIILDDASGFSTNGRIREIDAQQVLNAISVGLVPTSRLEIQILALYEKLGVDYQAWVNCPLSIQTENPAKKTKLQDIIARLADDDYRYKETKGTAGQIKAMQSVFVDEGQDHGGITGLASREKDFIINEDKSMNMAVIVPLVKSLNGEVMAGIIEQFLPVPQRYKGNGYTVTCPSMSLPIEVKNFDMARKYIAEKFQVPVEYVARMGESYFSHIGVTPQRIYPFAVTKPGASGWMAKGRGQGATSFAPINDLYKLMYLDNNDSFIKITAMVYQSTIGLDSDMSANMTFTEKHADRKSSFVGMSDTSYSPSPSKSNKNDFSYDK